MMLRRALLLVGSARPRGESTSDALGRYLLRQLEPGGCAGQVRYISHCRTPQALDELVAEIAASDLFLLSTPVYVDALPYLVVRACEHIAAARAAPGTAPVRFLALANCGFPEALHTHLALDICRVFAERARLQLVGALGLGGGEALRGRAPDRAGWLARHVTRALDLAADALLSGKPVPEKAVELMARPLVPALGYTLLGDRGWRQKARAHGVADLHARPYEGGTQPPVEPG